MKHTPGPWTDSGDADMSCRRFITARSGLNVAIVATYSPEVVAANAALISTAPELLEILEEIVTALDDEFLEDATRLGLDATIIEARMVLAKARGETEEA